MTLSAIGRTVYFKVRKGDRWLALSRFEYGAEMMSLIEKLVYHLALPRGRLYIRIMPEGKEFNMTKEEATQHDRCSLCYGD